MSEPMSNERLAWISEWAAKVRPQDAFYGTMRRFMRELTDEAQRARAEVEALRGQIANELNRAAELGYPANAAWVQEMHQAAYIARDGLDAWLAENGRNPDGTPQDGRRQPREPIRNEQDIDDLAAKPEDRLSDAEFESFQAALREARGDDGPEPEYRFVLADGTESEFDVHNGPCDCERQTRLGDGPWLAAGGWVSADAANPLEPRPVAFTLPSRAALEAGVQIHLRALNNRGPDDTYQNMPNTIHDDTTPEEEPAP